MKKKIACMLCEGTGEGDYTYDGLCPAFGGCGYRTYGTDPSLWARLKAWWKR